MTPSYAKLVECPICLRPGQSLGQSLKTFVRTFNTTVESHYSYCEACDFAYNETPFDDLSMAAYYQYSDQLRREFLTVEEARHISSQVRFISKYMKPMDSPGILEIGADFGAFLKLASQELNAKGYFDELNLEAGPILERHGLIDARSAENRDRRFDLIVMRHVLEHIVKPNGFLIGQKKRLAPGGLIFIEVPEYSSLDREQSDVFQLEHVNYFSLQSLCRTATTSGFHVVAMEVVRTPGYSTTPNLVARVILSLGGKERTKLQDVSDWKRLFSKSLDSVNRIDAFIKGNSTKKVAFYGAGSRTLEFFANSIWQDRPFQVFDKDPKKIGTNLYNCKVLDAAVIESSQFDYLVIMVTGYSEEVKAFLLSRGVPESKLLFVDKMEA